MENNFNLTESEFSFGEKNQKNIVKTKNKMTCSQDFKSKRDK